jgi:hypothetical protein
MSNKLSPGAANLLQVITRAPGHSRGDLMKMAGISRRVWSSLSGELKASGAIRTESSTSKKSEGKVEYLWYPNSASAKIVKPKQTKKSAMVKAHVRRGERSPSSSWSVTENRLLKKLWKEGQSDKQIARAFKKDQHCGNRTVGAISKQRQTERLLKTAGWTANHRSKYPEEYLDNKKKPVEVPVKETPKVEEKTTTTEQVAEVKTNAMFNDIAESIGVCVATNMMKLVNSGGEHSHNEYAYHADVKDGFNSFSESVKKSFEQVATTLDELHGRLKVAEEILAGMQDSQSAIDSKQDSVLRDIAEKLNSILE